MIIVFISHKILHYFVLFGLQSFVTSADGFLMILSSVGKIIITGRVYFFCYRKSIAIPKKFQL